MRTSSEIVGLGHALLDIFHRSVDSVIDGLGLTKGGMNPINDHMADMLSEGAQRSAPGGSMANSLAIAASIGASATFLCRTGSDKAGAAFIAGMTESGVDCPVPAHETGRTGRCVVFVTPDAERTMATSLGCCREIPAAAISAYDFSTAKVFAFDGYMLNVPDTKTLAMGTLIQAREHGVKTYMSLGDARSAAANASAVQFLLSSGLLTGLFANESEAIALMAARDFESAARDLQGRRGEIYVTRGSKGVTILGASQRSDIAATPIDKLVDTTGAGDAFAGGVLFARAKGRSVGEAAYVGLEAAAEIIQQVGARPLRSLAHLDDGGGSKAA